MIENKTIQEITDILDYSGPYYVRYDVSFKDIVFRLGPGFGYAKMFDELDISAKNQNVIPRLIGHNISDPTEWPSISELNDFGESLGYKRANIRELLYFCLDVRVQHNIHHEINMCDIVATGSETHITSKIASHYPMAPSGLSMSSLSKNAKCPMKVVILMTEAVS